MKLTTEEFKEEIYTDLIQEYDDLTPEEITYIIDVENTLNW